MAKALKVFVILFLLVAIAALVLSIMLFGKREIIKARTQKLENAVTKVTGTMSAGKEPFIADAAVRLDPSQLMDHMMMDGPLAQMQKLAENRYVELDNTYIDLKTTRDELAATKDELAITKADLARTKEQLEERIAEVARKNAEIARQSDQIAQLEQDKANQQIQIDELNNTVAKMEDEKDDLKDKIVTLEQTVVDLEAQLGQGTLKALPKGLYGKIVLVNRDWNFVVLDIGSMKGLVPNSEMLIHRGDKLVGKILISGVTRELAIADINNEWLQMPVQEGDYVAVQ